MIICSCKSFICGDNDIANLSFLSRDTLTTIKELAVHIRHIREKIEIDPKNPRYVKVVWGIGYKMEKHQK